MRKKNSVLKHSLYFAISLLLVLLWIILFILQGGVGIEGNVLLIPIKLAPLFLFSSFSFWLLLKMYDQKKRVLNSRNISLGVGVASILLSITFQYNKVSKRISPFKFKSKMFAHVEPIKASDSFTNRLMLSSAGFLSLMPFNSFDQEAVSIMSNISAESALVFELKRYLDDRTLKRTCSKYIEEHGDYNDCVVDFQKDIYNHYNFSSTGNILLVAVGALGTFKVKNLLASSYGDKDSYVLLKSVNDVIETSMLAAERSKSIILGKSKDQYFSLGSRISASSPYRAFENQVNYRYLVTALGKVDELISGVQKKELDHDSSTVKRDVSSTSSEKFEREKQRFQAIKTQFQDFKKGGFEIERLVLEEREAAKELDIALAQIKQKSDIFKAVAFFDSSLNKLSSKDFLNSNKEKQ